MLLCGPGLIADGGATGRLRASSRVTGTRISTEVSARLSSLSAMVSVFTRNGHKRGAVGLGGAVDARFGGGGGNLLAADQIMAEGKLHGARHQANGERAENTLANM